MEVELSFETSVNFYQIITSCIPEIILIVTAAHIRTVKSVVFPHKDAIATIPVSCWRYSVGR